MNSDTIIVDVQGFKDADNNFIIKELGLANREYTLMFLVKPPYPYKRLSKEEKKQVRWLEFNRGINWSEGYIDYREFRRIIVPYLDKKVILAKGLEKTKWIKNMCSSSTVINLDDKGCPNISKLYADYCKETELNCVHHHKMCALKNVNCIKKWYCNSDCVI